VVHSDSICPAIEVSGINIFAPSALSFVTNADPIVAGEGMAAPGRNGKIVGICVAGDIDSAVSIGRNCVAFVLYVATEPSGITTTTGSMTSDLVRFVGARLDFDGTIAPNIGGFDGVSGACPLLICQRLALVHLAAVLTR